MSLFVMLLYDTMQVRPEEAVKSLQSSNLDERRKAARFIKNAIIGNKLKKRLYANLGVIARYEPHRKFQVRPQSSHNTALWTYSHRIKMNQS